THTYAQFGNYSPVTVTITDTDANASPVPAASIPRQSTTVASTAHVVDAPIFPGAPLTITTTEGALFPTTFPTIAPGLTEVATFTDGNPLAKASQFNATIYWSGLPTNIPIIATLGTVIADPTVPGQFDVLGNHLFVDAAVYPLTIALGSAGGSTATATGSAVVNDAPLTNIPLSPTQSV